MNASRILKALIKNGDRNLDDVAEFRSEAEPKGSDPYS